MEAYVKSLDEYKSIWTQWIAVSVNGDNATYFDSYRVKLIPKNKKTQR